MRLLPPLAPLLAFAAAATLASCSAAAERPRVVVALDEAFAAARPGLAARLESPSLFGIGPAGLLMPARVVRVTMSEGAGKALDAAIAEGKKSGAKTVLVTSPLVARAIVSGGSWSGDPPLLVPEWPAGAAPARGAPGLWTAATDPVPAYRAAGAATGAFIAALAKEGGSPSCGLLFCEAPSRPRAALTAFAESFAAASEGKPLYVREIADQPTAAESAAKELLGSDIRVLFIALGSASGAAIRAAARPGLAIGADFPAFEAPAALAFRISPDDAGLGLAIARARLAAYRHGQGEGSGQAGNSEAVPALLVAGPAAVRSGAGGLDFGVFLSQAARQGD